MTANGRERNKQATRRALRAATLDLGLQRGLADVPVEDIATRAGVTKRTFFRYFPDKREVLFAGSGGFLRAFSGALDDLPDSATPMECVAACLDTVGATFAGRHEHSRRRHLVITANAELHERELVKLASVAAALAESLRARGVPEPAAGVTAETAVAVFRAAFERWVSTDSRELRDVLRESLAALRAVTAGG